MYFPIEHHGQISEWPLKLFILDISWGWDNPKLRLLFCFIFLVLGNSPLCVVFEWAGPVPKCPRPSGSQSSHTSPLPAFLAVKALTSPSAQVFEFSHLDMASETRETKTEHWWEVICAGAASSTRAEVPASRKVSVSYFWNFWTCFDTNWKSIPFDSQLLPASYENP